MSETRHQTVVEIKVDDHDVEQAGKAMERAFNPAAMKAVEEAVVRMTQAIGRYDAALGHAEERMNAMQAATKAGLTEEEKAREKQRKDEEAAAKRADEAVRRAERERHRKQNEDDKAKKREERKTKFEEKRKKALEDRQKQERWAAVQSGFGTVANMGMRAAGGIANVATGFTQASGGLSNMLGAVPVIGSFLGGVVTAMEGYYQEHVGQETAKARAYGVTGMDSSGFAGAVTSGTKYGLMPGESVGAAASLARASGLRGGALGGALGTQMDLEHLLGVQGAGRVIGAGQSSGGRVQDPSKLMERAVSAGMRAGFRESQLDGYLQGIAGWVESVRAQGIDLTVDTADRIVEGIARSTKLQGEAASKFAQSLASAISGQSKKGGLGTALAYQTAAELSPGSSIMAQMRAIEKPDAKFISRFVKNARRASGGDELAFSNVVGSFMPGANAEQVGRLFRGGDLDGGGGGTGAVKGALARARGGQGVFAVPSREANWAVTRADTGRQVASTVQTMQDAERQISVGLTQAMEPMFKQLTDTMKDLIEVYKTGGGDAVAAEVARRAAVGAHGIISEAWDATVDGVKNAYLGGSEGTIQRDVSGGARRVAPTPAAPPPPPSGGSALYDQLMSAAQSLLNAAQSIDKSAGKQDNGELTP